MINGRIGLVFIKSIYSASSPLTDQPVKLIDADRSRGLTRYNFEFKQWPVAHSLHLTF
jgi:hypothetical protein